MIPFRILVPCAVLLACAASLPAAAQPARPRPPSAAPAAPASAAPAPPPVPAAPQQTTASFGDWMLRCAYPVPETRSCEVLQGVQREDKPVAQVALGRPAKGQPMQLTVLVPPSVSLATAAAVQPGRETEGPALQLVWRRCLPAGCIAEAALGEEALRRLRGFTETGRITYADAATHAVVLPFSPRGLPQALDALAKEDAP